MGSAKWLVDAVAQRQSAAKGHMRQQLFDNAQTFEIAVNEALAPYQVKFLPCQSRSKMVRENPLFQEA